MSWGAQNRSKDAKTPNIGPAMSEKPIFCQLFNKLTPLPARPSDLKLAHWKPGINLLSEGALKEKKKKAMYRPTYLLLKKLRVSGLILEKFFYGVFELLVQRNAQKRD